MKYFVICTAWMTSGIIPTYVFLRMEGTPVHRNEAIGYSILASLGGPIVGMVSIIPVLIVTGNNNCVMNCKENR